MRADPRRAPGGPVALAVAAWLVVAAPVWAQTTVDVEAAVAVATRAVQGAFGGDAEVTLSAPVLSLTGDGAKIATAVAEPQSRTSGPVRFVLYAAGEPMPRRVGRLTARVDVHATHLRTRVRVPARRALAPDDVATVRDDIGRQPFSTLPTLDTLTGAVARRALLEGEVLTAAALVERSLVASGDEVVTVARVGALEVRGRAIAAQSGGLGDTVIVVNPDSHRRLRARVVAEAEVEVLHGS